MQRLCIIATICALIATLSACAQKSTECKISSSVPSSEVQSAAVSEADTGAISAAVLDGINQLHQATSQGVRQIQEAVEDQTSSQAKNVESSSLPAVKSSSLPAIVKSSAPTIEDDPWVKRFPLNISFGDGNSKITINQVITNSLHHQVEIYYAVSEGRTVKFTATDKDGVDAAATSFGKSAVYLMLGPNREISACSTIHLTYTFDGESPVTVTIDIPGI